MLTVEHGIYLIDDTFFQMFPSETWMQNKSQTRPHYYSVRDASGLLWMIPMSSRTAKYRAQIEKLESIHGKGNCAFYHIGTVHGRESAFIISGMFPVTEKFILRPYQMENKAVIVKNDALNKVLRQKAMRYIKLLEHGKLKDFNNVLEIRKTLAVG